MQILQVVNKMGEAEDPERQVGRRKMQTACRKSSKLRRIRATPASRNDCKRPTNSGRPRGWSAPGMEGAERAEKERRMPGAAELANGGEMERPERAEKERRMPEGKKLEEAKNPKGSEELAGGKKWKWQNELRKNVACRKSRSPKRLINQRKRRSLHVDEKWKWQNKSPGMVVWKEEVEELEEAEGRGGRLMEPSSWAP